MFICVCMCEVNYLNLNVMSHDPHLFPVFQYEKQIKKLEKDLKETEAAETISVKLKAVGLLIFMFYMIIW